MDLIIPFLVGFFISLLVFGLIIFFLQRKGNQEKMIADKFKEIMPTLLKETSEQLITLADQKLGAEKKEIRTDMENKRAEIERMITQIYQELRTNQKKLQETDEKTVGSFNALKSTLDEYKQITGKLSTTTEQLKNVLSNNQLRGQFGERVAEDLLKMCGFVKGTDYEFNIQQANRETRPDFAVFLPDGVRINVDSKFPLANFQRMVETDESVNKTQRIEFAKAFERDIREKVKQVTTRDYINPEARTVDFVILFIPNEQIFSYIYENMSELWTDAMEKKVVFCGPFSFTAILRMVRQAYDNFKYQKNITNIVGHLKAFQIEFEKFTGEFDKVGKKIAELEGTFDMVSKTRVNVLRKKVEKISESDVPEIGNSKVLEMNHQDTFL